ISLCGCVRRVERGTGKGVVPLFRRGRPRRGAAEPEDGARAVPEVSESVEGDDELEGSELARRLRRLEWPHPPEDVRDRCLEEIMKRVEQGVDPGVASGGAGGVA